MPAEILMHQMHNQQNEITPEANESTLNAHESVRGYAHARVRCSECGITLE